MTTLRDMGGRFATMAAALDTGAYSLGRITTGVRIHQYEVQEALGSGGMGRVFAARHHFLHKRLAIKTLSAESPDPVVAERFMREARALVALAGPSVVSIYDAGLFKGSPYFVMDLVDTFLDRMIERGGSASAAYWTCWRTSQGFS